MVALPSKKTAVVRLCSTTPTTPRVVVWASRVPRRPRLEDLCKQVPHRRQVCVGYYMVADEYMLLWVWKDCDGVIDSLVQAIGDDDITVVMLCS